MKFKYVDIGTADFQTSCDSRKPEDLTLLVEPLFHKLSKLPNHDGILKAPYAIGEQSGYEYMYFISDADIAKYTIRLGFGGCNRLGAEHPTIRKFLPKVVQSKVLVRVITFGELVMLYDIRSIEHLKIDTEGMDHIILDQVLDWIQELNIKTITFEYHPAFGNTSELNTIINTLKDLYGFTIRTDGDNRIAER